MSKIEEYALWRRTLADQNDDFNIPRGRLRESFIRFRERAKPLVQDIGALLPGLTVHDISHLDGLWRVADEIAGAAYPINPAEAFVLGGAFLIHDAALVVAAFEDRMDGVKASIAWNDLIAMDYNGEEPAPGSDDEKRALFHILRQLHAERAKDLAGVSWRLPDSEEPMWLLEDKELREYYGNVIGEIAASHHWEAHKVALSFKERILNAPFFLPTEWQVDVLKLAFLLRTADAAHLDAERAPWFLFALRRPDEFSLPHWQFQARMGQATRNDRGELRLSAGAYFGSNERRAWWLAYDTACMIHRELQDARGLMLDANRSPFAAAAVEHVSTPEAFARNVRPQNWEPIDASPRIGDVSRVIANLGGARLYGDKPEVALRELIQNAADAVRALRALQVLEETEGWIEVALDAEGDHCWLHVTDNGVGMSRYVLLNVLLDFGRSLWSDAAVRSELPKLSASGFQSVGRFGIGFFSVFMLGEHVRVTSNRPDSPSGDGQWLLEFETGLRGRPMLRKPRDGEGLQRRGTRVSVALSAEMLAGMFNLVVDWDSQFVILGEKKARDSQQSSQENEVSPEDHVENVVARQCPTLDVEVRIKISGGKPKTIITPGDWETIEPNRLYARTILDVFRRSSPILLDLLEPEGTLVGRVGYGLFHSASITYAGLWSGKVQHLYGVLLGGNSPDLARAASDPLVSPEAWRIWAEKWIDGTKEPDYQEVEELHPLCPKRDFAVYTLGEEHLDENDLRTEIVEFDSLYLVVGHIAYEDYDDVPKHRFDSDLALNNDTIRIPSNSRLAKELKIPQINYLNRFDKLLRDAWGDFEAEKIDSHPIGQVGSEAIERNAICYRKVE